MKHLTLEVSHSSTFLLLTEPHFVWQAMCQKEDQGGSKSIMVVLLAFTSLVQGRGAGDPSLVNDT